jgi:hypothetical protein
MDLRRLRHGEWIAGIAGAVLLGSLFFDWYSGPRGATETAWETFTAADIVMAIAAAMGIALAVLAASQRSVAVPQAISSLTVPVALVASVLAVIHTLSLPDGATGREPALYVGLVAAIAVLLGGWRSMSDQSFPSEVAPKVDVTPLPAPKPRSEPPGEH